MRTREKAAVEVVVVMVMVEAVVYGRTFRFALRVCSINRPLLLLLQLMALCNNPSDRVCVRWRERCCCPSGDETQTLLLLLVGNAGLLLQLSGNGIW